MMEHEKDEARLSEECSEEHGISEAGVSNGVPPINDLWLQELASKGYELDFDSLIEDIGASSLN